MPPNPPTTIQTSMPFHQTRMIWTTSSKTYNDNLNEKLLFSPNAIWMKQKTTTELIEERMAKRKALGGWWCVVAEGGSEWLVVDGWWWVVGDGGEW